jgi:predicted MPP superfamily phosphohydrolase
MNRRIFIKTMAGLGGGLSAYGIINFFQAKNIEVSFQKLNIDRSSPPLRIVAVSDLHLPSRYAAPDKLITLINAQEPDIFALVGDTIDRRGNEHLAGIFGDVSARIGKYAVLGNWEYQGQVNSVEMRKVFNESDVRLLINESVDLGDYVLVGLDDYVQGNPDYRLLEKVLNSEKTVILLNHCPAIFDHFPSNSNTPTIVISGHTHGGQIAPFGITFWTPEGSGSYVKNLYKKNNRFLYVMRGIGTTGIPIRIGAKPEILVLDMMPI